MMVGLVATGALFATLVTLGPAMAASTGTAAGLVTAADDSTPIQGITVCAIKRSSTGGFGAQTCAQTGADGRYSMTLPIGNYSFTAEDSYLYGDWVQQDYHELRKYTVASGATRTASFQMVRGARITGHLKAPDGSGPGHTYMGVRAFHVDSNGITRRDANLISNVTSSGHFEVAKMPAGRYRLQISDNSGTYAWANQWYPDSAAASGGSIISVTAGQQLTDRDAPLTVPGSITVQLLKPTGTPIGGQIDFFDADGRLLFNFDGNTTSKQTMRGLHPGAYKVRASPRTIPSYVEWLSHKRSFATANAVTVKSGVTSQRGLTFHYPTLTATKRPVMRLDLNSIEVSPATWNAKPRYVRNEWWRDGVMIDREGFDYRIARKSDVGHRFRVCQIADRSGYADGRTCSDYSRKVTMY